MGRYRNDLISDACAVAFEDARIRRMDARESALRAIKDRVAAALGELDEALCDVEDRQNYRRLTGAASELHKCADEMQNILMRLKPR